MQPHHGRDGGGDGGACGGDGGGGSHRGDGRRGRGGGGGDEGDEGDDGAAGGGVLLLSACGRATVRVACAVGLVDAELGGQKRRDGRAGHARKAARARSGGRDGGDARVPQGGHRDGAAAVPL